MATNTNIMDVAYNVKMLVERLLCYEGAIAVPYGFLSERPYEVFKTLLLDRPELMHVEGLFDVVASPLGYEVLHVRYSLGQHETLKRLGDMEKATMQLVNSCDASPCDKKLERARDWLLGNAVLVAKNMQEVDNGYAPIMYGLGSPVALVEAFQFIAHRLGVACAANFGSDEIMDHQAPRNPWIDVYELAGQLGAPASLLGCVDIVGDARLARMGKPLGPVLHDLDEMTNLYGESHEAVSAYRALYGNAR